ncbi:hypothetical protein BDR03DRAFT_1037101 [Suillus americanus]|nr:hypothetical protein BDR03DRAFT_1037101 [Suillus americanus]
MILWPPTSMLLNMKSRDTDDELLSAGAKYCSGHCLQYPGSTHSLARGHLGLLQALDMIMGVVVMLLLFILFFLRGCGVVVTQIAAPPVPTYKEQRVLDLSKPNIDICGNQPVAGSLTVFEIGDSQE